MFSLLKKEFNDHRLSLPVYCLVMVVLLAVYVGVYPSIHQASQQLTKLLQAYPKAFLRAFNIDQLNFDTLDKFIAVEQFSFTWPILAIVLTLSRAGNAIAGEIEKRTMGLYLSLPVWRPNIFFAKYLAGLLAVVIFAAVSILATVPLAALFHQHTQSAWYVTLAVVALLFMWAIFSVGMLFSAAFSERSKVYMTVGGILLVMYAMNVIANLKTSLKWLSDYSAFHYFNYYEILVQHTVRLSAFWVFGTAIIVSAVLGAWIFTKRDVPV